jgi:hypothetical protein
VDATTWPGTAIAAWPAIPPQSADGPAPTGPYIPPRGRGIQAIPDGIPLSSWLPLGPKLTTHGLRHSHRTWMAEDGIPDILAERRLGHEVPGMRRLYTHVSDLMRDALTKALQARWEDSLRDRAAIHPHSPVPLLDELLAPHRRRQPEGCIPSHETGQAVNPRQVSDTDPSANVIQHQRQSPTPGGREKAISQIPPKQPEGPTLLLG